jgi:hypothetical protein
MAGVNLPPVQLNDEVRRLQRGVEIAEAGSHDSGVFGCHLFRGRLRFGFLYRNGNVTRIAFLNSNGRVQTGSIIRRTWIIIFRDVTTTSSINQLEAADLTQGWLDQRAQELLQNQLRELSDTRDELADILNGLRI